jgi:hypothetical protein
LNPVVQRLSRTGPLTSSGTKKRGGGRIPLYTSEVGTLNGRPDCPVILCRALSFWYTDRAAWERLVRRIMDQDWSWSTPALDYIELYYKALKS